MSFDNSKLPINQLMSKINDAAKEGISLTLDIDEVKLISKEFGDQYFIPVLSQEQIIKLCNEGKLGQPIFPQKTKLEH
ncbi:hypothetical protein EA770_06980 [Acinetobacter baumannii]|nr:hypothetical protein EA770_06980 [Acinetobacter baumannii]